MKYQITHKTLYRYSALTPLSFNQIHLKPRIFHGQECLHFSLTTSPRWSNRSDTIDIFGNESIFFTVQEEHSSLEVTSESLVDVKPVFIPDEVKRIPWENIKSEAHPFLYDSPFVKRSQELARYASPSFPPGRPFFEAVEDLTQRIHREFSYTPNVTTTHTPLLEILKSKKGVCQDFTHVGVGCLRSLGFPARYVSGYLETLPSHGKTKLVGADASHAWMAVPFPSFDWIGFDPTNNLVVSDRHMTIAWGRDYGDVIPLNGIYWGKGSQTLSVSVNVTSIGG